MSFDFGDSKPSDPTADFLARERDAAGVLSGETDLFASSTSGGAHLPDDFERSASAFPALDDEGLPLPSNNRGSSAIGFNSGAGFAFDDDNAPARQPSVDDEVGKFTQSFPELDGPSNANGGVYDDDDGTNGFMDARSSTAAIHDPRAQPVSNTVPAVPPSYSYGGYDHETNEEPEAVRLWRERQKDTIARRDAEAERRKAEAVSKAEQDIDRFYAEYNAKKEKNIAANKEHEARFSEQRTRELAEGTTWTRVTKILDLHNSQSKTIARSGPGASDLSRLKEVYLSLRREGDTAPGAAGY